jgi:hypothetical protein
MQIHFLHETIDELYLRLYLYIHYENNCITTMLRYKAATLSPFRSQTLLVLELHSIRLID